MGAQARRRTLNTIFADAGFWIALRDAGDVEHGPAVEIATTVLKRRFRLVTTPLVFAEVYARFSRNRPVREQFIRDVWDNPAVHLEQASFDDQKSALQILRHHRDKNFSFSDAVSFAVMARMKIHSAISFDAHFRQYGLFKIITSDTDV